ncbi:O-antigen ligase [Mucilaginibacter sp. BT774]|uniref:O-antigen ligase family protein n=1 Tax=Mucilaginibacter sp. BT774 TaxID=3062276 RepID=UPI0026750C7B|nr:O-antigen ligase family protein [Mucilaginibacter sp. BT774]MDO3624772.1 O-antigen ligase family protein [Mucilaginibacter sp. BT774]
MKELFLIKDNLANKVSYYHVMLLLLSLPFDRFYSHLILASLAIHTIIQFKKESVKPLFTLRTAVLQSVFWLTLIGTIYTINFPQSLLEWELDLPILLTPLIFCFNPLDLKKYRQNLLLLFSLGCTATIGYLYFDALTTIRHYQLPLSSILSPAFTNHNFSEPIDMHATFLSLQIAVALIYILSRLVDERLSTSTTLLYLFCSLVLTAGIIQLSSKSIFAALFLVINFAIPWLLLQGKRRGWYLLVSGGLSCIILIGILNSNALRTRYLNELKEDLSPKFAGQTVEPRLERWKIATNLIRKSPVIGYGTGSEIQLLQEQYFAKKFYSSYLNRLNSHNQYLSFLIKTGIWGLGIYSITLVYGFRCAIKKRDIVFFSFMILIAIVSLSENVLDADKGVMFYSILLSYFVFVSEQPENINIHIRGHKFLRKAATNQTIESSLL